MTPPEKESFYERHECVPGEFFIYGLIVVAILVLVVVGC
jgi:hypothetical protein